MLADGERSKNNALLESHAGPTNQSLAWSNCAQGVEESNRLAETVRDTRGNRSAANGRGAPRFGLVKGALAKRFLVTLS